MTDSLSVRVIDSHTGGEPTRVVVSGGPQLAGVTLAERLEDFRASHDRFRSAVVNEPRGSDVLVGALLTEPVIPGAAAGVIFFNNVGSLGMCGHGAIGVVETLRFLGRLSVGSHVLETPVGTVTAILHEDGDVSIRNVPAYRHAEAVAVDLPGYGTVSGDVAWGGNWFFLVQEHGQHLSLTNVGPLTDYASRLRRALGAARITGADGAEIDHVELFGPPSREGLHSRNFVLCPGLAYDRSPCGTGTSAKMACLVADGKLRPGETWRQESITGSVFEGSVAVEDGVVIPAIRGRAWITADATLHLDPRDPFCWGMTG